MVAAFSAMVLEYGGSAVRAERRGCHARDWLGILAAADDPEFPPHHGRGYTKSHRRTTRQVEFVLPLLLLLALFCMSSRSEEQWEKSHSGKISSAAFYTAQRAAVYGYDQ